jgi:hypothetical protein
MALVTGGSYGRDVWPRLNQSDGCAIARRKLVGLLFPSAP